MGLRVSAFVVVKGQQITFCLSRMCLVCLKRLQCKAIAVIASQRLISADTISSPPNTVDLLY